MTSITGGRRTVAIPSAGAVPDRVRSRRTWSIGPVFVLRHAGLPFDWVAGLAAPPDLVALAEAVLDVEDRLRSVAPRVASGDRLVSAAVRALDPEGLPARPDPLWEQARGQWRRAVRAYLDAYPAADEAAGDALREVLAREPVQEAVFWSNPDVYANMLRPYLAGPKPLNARWRRARRQLYTYVQRLCAKNETVSFFGPMGYGRVVGDGPAPTGTGAAGTGTGAEVPLPDPDGALLRTGLPVRRRVFLASWAAREIASAVARDPRLRTALPVRRTGFPLPAEQGDVPDVIGPVVRVLDVAGRRGATLPRIAAESGLGVRAAALVVQRLVAAGCAEFGLLPAPYDLYPLDALLAGLGGLPGADAAAWAQRIRGLRDLLTDLEATAFPQRIATVERIEATFTELTGCPARRGAGAVYADRAVFYEECASPFEFRVGPQLAHRWAEGITAALEVSTAHGAQAQARAIREISEQLGPGARLDLADYGERLREAFDRGGTRFDAAHAPVYPVQAAQERIEELLRAAERSPGDRYVLIDLCPVAGDVDDLPGAGLVLSRCHHHLLTDGWLATMDSGRDFGADAAAWVAGHPELVGVDVGRRNKGFYRFPGRRVPLRAPSTADADDPQVIWPRGLTVSTGEPTGGSTGGSEPTGLRCTDPQGRDVALYLPLSDYVKYPPYAALSHPQVLHAAFEGEVASPAVEIDQVMYQRPRWTVEADRLAHAQPAGRFLGLRRMARRIAAGRAPDRDVRFVFCRTGSQRKPYLIDLASVLAADLVGHLTADGGAVLAEQMVPGPDHLWLKDGEGHRYTSELRMHLIGREQG